MGSVKDKIRDIGEAAVAITVPVAAPAVLAARGAREQAKAAQQISTEQMAAIAEAQERALGGLGAGQFETEDRLRHLLADTRRISAQGQEQALGAVRGGTAGSLAELGRTEADVLRQLGATEQAALQPLQRVADIGLSALPGATTAIGTRDLTAGPGAESGVANLLAGPAGQRSSTDLFRPIEEDPGFQFELEQGQRALGAAASARGGRSGGRFAKDLARFSQGLAATRSQEAFNRRLAAAGVEQQDLSRLAGLASTQAGLQQQALGRLAGLSSTQAGLESQAGLAAQRNLGALAQLGIGSMSDIGELRASIGQRGADVMGDIGRLRAGAIGQAGLTERDLILGATGQRLDLETGIGGKLAGLPIDVAGAQSNILIGAPLQGQLGALQLPAQTAGGTEFALSEGLMGAMQIGGAIAGQAAGAGGFSFGGGG